jgi:hypothetical protein
MTAAGSPNGPKTTCNELHPHLPHPPSQAYKAVGDLSHHLCPSAHMSCASLFTFSPAIHPTPPPFNLPWPRIPCMSLSPAARLPLRQTAQVCDPPPKCGLTCWPRRPCMSLSPAARLPLRRTAQVCDPPPQMWSPLLATQTLHVTLTCCPPAAALDCLNCHLAGISRPAASCCRRLLLAAAPTTAAQRSPAVQQGYSSTQSQRRSFSDPA